VRPEASPFGRSGLAWGALLIVGAHLVAAAPIYLGLGAPATKDLVLSYQPMHATLARQGWPPYRLWEPRGGLGFPMLAESQASQLYPPSVLARLFFDPDLGIFPLVYLHLPLSGLFMLALARELRLPLPAACIAAFAWMGCGFMVTHLDIPPMLYQAAWLPAAAAALLRFFRSGRLLPLAGAGAALGCMLLAGHFQVAFYAFLFLLAWSWFLPGVVGGVSRPRALLGFATAVGLSLAISYAQIRPTFDFLLQSSRGEQGGETWLSWLPLQLPALVQPFLFGVSARPTLVGKVPAELSTYWGAGVYWETALYVGLVPFVLALAGLARRDGGRRWLWLAVALSLALAAGRYLPGHDALWRLPLWGRFRFPARLLVLSQFCLSLLAGYGASQLAQLDVEGLRRWLRRIVVATALFCLGLTAAWVTASRLAAAGSPRAAAAAATLAPHAAGNLRLLALVAVFALALAIAVRFARARPWLPWLLTALTAIELAHYFRAQQLLVGPAFYRQALTLPGGCDPRRPESRYYSVARFAADPVDHQLDLLPASLNLRTDCANVEYRGSLFHARHSRYTRELLESYADPEGRIYEQPRRPGLLAIAGVDRLVRRQPAVGAGLSLGAEVGATCVYETAGSAPALRRAAGARFVNGAEAAWQAVSAEDFEAGAELVIEGPGDDQRAGTTAASGATGARGGEPLETGVQDRGATGEVRVLSRSPERLELLTSGTAAGWIVWSQSWSPRWRALVDGRPQPLLRANYLVQAVAVPAGESRVRLEYSEPALRHGGVLALMALGAALGFGWWDWRRGREGAAGEGVGRS
jgi:hypothetical protein